MEGDLSRGKPLHRWSPLMGHTLYGNALNYRCPFMEGALLWKEEAP